MYTKKRYVLANILNGTKLFTVSIFYYDLIDPYEYVK